MKRFINNLAIAAALAAPLFAQPAWADSAEVSSDMTPAQMRAYYQEQTDKSLQNWEKQNWSVRENRPFDLANPAAQEFTITPEIAKRINLRQQVDAFAAEAKVSTAGVRENQNVNCPWDHRYRINEYMLALMAESLSLLVPELHREHIDTLHKVNAQKIRQEMGQNNAAIIETIYGMPLEQAIEMARSQPLRIVGGEVRPNTPQFVNLASRIYAAHGQHVFLTEDPRNRDTSTIFVWSFLTYMLGLSGGDYYTSSHGAPQKQSDKILAPDGSQYLPPQYAKIVEKMYAILDKCEKEGYTIKLAPADSPLLHHSLTYERMAQLYANYLRQGTASPQTLAKINEAIDKGMRLKLDFFGGSGFKTFQPVLSELGIEQAFEQGYIRAKEDPFFHNIGFRVAPKKGSATELEVVHDSVDASMPIVVKSAGYDKILANSPMGQIVFNVDPDADRFVAGQIVPKAEAATLDKLGIAQVPLDQNRVFALYSPNQFFLLLAENDRASAVEEGVWDKYSNFDIHTYVSALSWDEWADANKIPVVHTPVGFKEIAAIERQVESADAQRRAKGSTAPIEVKDERGTVTKIGLNPKVHHAGEESGGKIGGPRHPISNLLGQKIIGMREKSSGEACISAMALSARLYLQSLQSGNPADYYLHNHLQKLFADNNVANPMEFRGDIIHYNEAIVDPQELAKAKIAGTKEKESFNDFFRILALAMSDPSLTKSGKVLTLDEVKEILCEAMPEISYIWKELARIDIWSDGLQLWFNKGPVRDMCLRPSGTDAKSKVYMDGQDKNLLREIFENNFRYFQAKPGKAYLEKVKVSPSPDSSK
ncbi:hypothetical protein IJT17_10860 [bacterium]|nr:hypothetical protein [bacterium]